MCISLNICVNHNIYVILYLNRLNAAGGGGGKFEVI